MFEFIPWWASILQQQEHQTNNKKYNFSFFGKLDTHSMGLEPMTSLYNPWGMKCYLSYSSFNAITKIYQRGRRRFKKVSKCSLLLVTILKIVPLLLLGNTIVLIQPTQTSHIPHCWMCSALDEGEGCSSKQECIHKSYWQLITSKIYTHTENINLPIKDLYIDKWENLREYLLNKNWRHLKQSWL